MAQGSNKEPRRGISILIVGKTGSGKSSLVNGIVGMELCKAGYGPESVTYVLEPYSATVRKEGVEENVTVWDSPGLGDGQSDKHQYVEALREIVPEVDLLVYCIRMDQALDDDDKKALVTCLDLNKSSKIWEHSVVALTFANQITFPYTCQSEEDRAKFFYTNT